MNRLLLLFSIMVASTVSVAAQSGDSPAKRADDVRKAVEQLLADGHTKVIGVRNDLRVFAGEIIVAEDDRFRIQSKKKKTSGSGVEVVRYDAVLELEGKGVLLSYFPDPNQTPFADWSAVRRLQHGDSLDIDLVGNQSVSGTLLTTSETNITFIDGNRNTVIERDRIVRVTLARRDESAAKRILAGAAKGAEMGKPSGGSTTAAGAAVQGAVRLGAIVAGAGAAAAKRYPNDRLLIYAK